MTAGTSVADSPTTSAAVLGATANVSRAGGSGGTVIVDDACWPPELVAVMLVVPGAIADT